MRLYHFRTSDNKEVDFVIEKANGQLAGIEVKKRDSVDIADFKGLKELQSLVGDDYYIKEKMLCRLVKTSGLSRFHIYGDNYWRDPILNV